MIARTQALTIALTIALGACHDAAVATPVPVAPPATAAASRSSTTVRWRAARRPGRTSLLEAPARVVPDPQGWALVTTPLRARVVAVHAVVGSEVVLGAPLIELAMPEAAAAAAAYLAAVDQLAAHERRAAQLAELRKEGLSRASDLAAVELELARLRGERDVAAATLRAANLAVGDAAGLAARGGRTILRAPRAGLVTHLAAVIGGVASPDDALVEIAGGGSTRVEVMLAYPLPQDSRFEIELASGTTPARFVALAPARELDGTTRAWFDVDAPLPPGAPGRLRVMPATGTTVLVPATAIATDEAGTFVWKREGDLPRRIVVRVLITSGSEALVSGPAEGDEIASVAGAVGEVNL